MHARSNSCCDGAVPPACTGRPRPLSAAVVFPLTMFFRENVFMVDIEGYNTLIFFSIAISLLIIFTHRSNIRRLLRGTESRITSVRPGLSGQRNT